MNCPFCGTPLQETTHGRYFCPNCGIVGEQREPEDQEETRRADYIG